MIFSKDELHISMRTWKQFIKEVSVFQDTEEPRTKVEGMIAYLSHFEPQHVEDVKDKLLELKSVLEDKLTGA